VGNTAGDGDVMGHRLGDQTGSPSPGQSLGASHWLGSIVELIGFIGTLAAIGMVWRAVGLRPATCVYVPASRAATGDQKPYRRRNRVEPSALFGYWLEFRERGFT
jgi:hypothetical protein